MALNDKALAARFAAFSSGFSGEEKEVLRVEFNAGEFAPAIDTVLGCAAQHGLQLPEDLLAATERFYAGRTDVDATEVIRSIHLYRKHRAKALAAV